MIWIKIAGVAFEVIGTFLLAAEAIKTENLLTLARRLTNLPEFFYEGWGYFILAPTALLASILMVDHVVRQYFWRYVIVNYGWQYQDSDWFFLVTGVIAFALIIATVFSFLGAARLLKWVNDHTANGTVGILGFV